MHDLSENAAYLANFDFVYNISEIIHIILIFN